MYLIKQNNKLEVYLVYDQELTKNYIIYKNKQVIFTTFNKIKALQKQIELISEARDRLLPKLMSGEIEV